MPGVLAPVHAIPNLVDWAQTTADLLAEFTTFASTACPLPLVSPYTARLGFAVFRVT
jgi:hypothetical protein